MPREQLFIGDGSGLHGQMDAHEAPAKRGKGKRGKRSDSETQKEKNRNAASNSRNTRATELSLLILTNPILSLSDDKISCQFLKSFLYFESRRDFCQTFSINISLSPKICKDSKA